MTSRSLFSLVFSAVVAGGCVADGGGGGPLVEPPFDDGKADVGDRVTDRGPLGYGAAATGVFAEDLEFHGYRLSARPNARVDVEITQRGSSRGLDTTLFVYGPRNAAGGFGTTAVAFDDDAGYGRLSRLSNLSLEAGGEYLVVVGTRDARGRGNYRIEARCGSGECEPIAQEPVSGCHPVLRSAIDACVAGWLAEDEWFYETTRRAIVEGCADAEPVTPAVDVYCASAPSAPLCTRSLEELSQAEIPACRDAVWNAMLDELCVFGERYRDIFESDALVVLDRREIRVGDDVTPLERTQIVEAIGVSAHAGQSYDDSLASVDDGYVNQTKVWDKSNHREFTVYEYGAGDNSFGAIFAAGTETIVARNYDGDIGACEVTWGDEARECVRDSDCRGEAVCVGRYEDFGFGRCVARREHHPAEDTSCSVQADCPMNSGLICQGAAFGGDGLCRPAWQQSRFSTNPAQQIADNNAAGTEVTLLAYGLATVPTDAWIDLYITHPRISDLRVTLINPAGSETPVFTGEREGTEIYLRDQAIGTHGDENANGIWTLRAVDTRSGAVGTIHEFGLRITSRWD